MNTLHLHRYVNKLFFVVVLLCLLITSFASMPAKADQAASPSANGSLMSCVPTVPTVTFTHVPPFGSTDDNFLEGRVDGLNPEEYKVVIYIYPGSWWVKPSFAYPLTTINSDGNWRAKIRTGGIDELATQIAAFVLPNGTDPPFLGGPTLPQELFDLSVAHLIQDRYRTIEFSGFTWNVKSFEAKTGPGPNYFSAGEDNVWVDSSGNLHLTITYENNKWYSTEIFTQVPLGYGTYTFTIASPVDQLDENVVLGFFTWDESAPEHNNREIDIEFSNGELIPGDENSQYVVQPWDHPGNIYRFVTPPTLTTHTFEWRNDQVHFISYYGSPSNPGNEFANWLYTGADIPLEGEEVKARINLWLKDGNPPSDGQIVEVVIEAFNYDGIPVTKDISLFIGDTNIGNYNLDSSETIFQCYANTLGGPLKVISTNADRIFTTQVVNSGSSYNELAGFPVEQFTTEYWFPLYDHGYPSVSGNNMRTWILVGNPHDTLTAEVEITIGGVLQTVPGSYPATTTFSIAPGENVTPRWIGLVDGPVQVKSTNGVDIFASERVFTVPYNSFNEVMGYPADQFTTEYWFPWYDTVYMNTYLLVGNTSSTTAAEVDIYVGDALKGSYNIPVNETIKVSYPNLVDGPVRVVSTNGIDIVASEFTLSGTENSFNEVMGYPFDQFDTEYWFPWYDHGYPSVTNNKMRTWILVGNPSDSTTANVEIYIDGVLKGSYAIDPGANVTPRWIGDVAGPVRVVSDIPVFTSERVFTVPTNAFNEFMGIPLSQFTTEYWFTWYDSVYMNSTVVISNP